MRCLDRVNVRALLVVVGLMAAAIALWDGDKLRRGITDESPGRVRVGEVVHQQAELARVLEEIRRIDADIDRLRTRLGELEHTYSQPRL
jgi:hypothetical protein